MSREELEQYEMIKQSGFKSEDNMNQMQQEFFTKYAKSKGWDITNLTNEQIREIKGQNGFRNPGLIKG